jgi:PIN domain nuclease of toxin-antitoxin system
VSLLLDTHALLWWLTDDPRLSAVAHDAIRDADDGVWTSVASIWEASIKSIAGRLDQTGDLLADCAASGVEELAVTGRHAIAAAALPLHHRDPFDRMLVAQAQLEGLRLVTRDPRIAQYDVVTLW